jgi:hypothetical protein
VNDAAGNSTQADDDPQALRRGIDRLAQAGHWLSALLSRAIHGRDRGTAPARPGVGRDVDLIIARRALMLHNRSRKSASAYRRVHAILSRGRA